jgi:hypothetical protein
MRGHPVQFFTQHPASVGETYGQHLVSASSFAIRMLWGGIACFLHGLFPFAFTTTGSDQIRVLHDKMVVNRHRQAAKVQTAGQRHDASRQNA